MSKLTLLSALLLELSLLPSFAEKPLPTTVVSRTLRAASGQVRPERRDSVREMRTIRVTVSVVIAGMPRDSAVMSV